MCLIFLSNFFLLRFHWSRGKKQRNFNKFIAGECEHRHPFLSVILPQSHAYKHRFNSTVLRMNTQRMVTHRDFHQTLTALLGGAVDYSFKALKESLRGMLAGNGRFVKGTDLLTELVPKLRSCSDTDIPSEWCNCFFESKRAARQVCQVDAHLGENCSVASFLPSKSHEQVPA